MRFHRNLVLAVIQTLDLIFNKQFYADKAVEQILKSNKRWGSRDRGFIAETVYEIVRWNRLYTEIANSKEPYNKNDLWRIFAVWATLRGHSLPPWDEFKNLPARRIKGKYDQLSKIRKFRESIPDWLDELGVQALGEIKWTEELKALNKPAEVILRTNTLNISVADLQKKLKEEGIDSERMKAYPEALKLKKRSNVFITNSFKSGLFEVQDASSQTVAHFVEPKAGMRIVDACAGAGGKSLHLAALMENKGQIIAMDIYRNKLTELKRRARRNKIHNIETRLVDSTKTVKKLYGKADRVLIDAPCSGLGVLRRNPDAKWKLRREFIEQIVKTQSDILKLYSKMVRPGGKLIYATCSILPVENANQIAKFLGSTEGSEFKLEQEKHIWPSESGFDGFYMARLVKSN